MSDVPFPRTQLENLSLPRMIIGSNSFCGFSHLSAARSKWLKEYFTVERIAEAVVTFVEHGIDAYLGGPREESRRACLEAEQRTGKPVTLILTPSGATKAELAANIDLCAEWGAKVCMPHVSYTDSHAIQSENRIVDLDEHIKRIRGHGMIPGLSTHRAETLKLVERGGFDTPVIIQMLNPIGFLCSVETDWVVRAIGASPKHVIAIKPLAAGRVLPPTGIRFAYNSIKAKDMVCIGVMSSHEAKEDIVLALEAMGAIAEQQRELQVSRSKAALI
ncbi:MAG: hypothetical protein NTW86_32060 [Candidatus Sumerlaeota bacterium]|nr:hypothetical protein [Candidatus Sumerlaeota bacterium]